MPLKNLLFITWDADSPHYMQGLFLPILAGLQSRGYQVHVLHHSSLSPQDVDALGEQAAGAGMNYHHVIIKRSPVGFIKAFMQGVRFIRSYRRKHAEGILMPRSLINSAVMRVAGIGKHVVVFDADGLKLEERLDFAGWKESDLKYKAFRNIEHWVHKKAQVILTRSMAAKRVLINNYPFLENTPIFKVVNGKNTEQFQPLDPIKREAGRASLGLKKEDLLVVYCGTVAPQYCLNEMLQWFGWLKESKPQAKFLILTGDAQKVKAHAAFEDLKGSLILNTVHAADIPQWLGLADVSLALRRASHSMQGVAPIKIGEYLLCGLPVIASRGIGDTEADLKDLNASQVINEQDETELRRSLNTYLASLELGQEVPLKESVEAGKKHYSLEAAVDSYMAALEQVRN